MKTNMRTVKFNADNKLAEAIKDKIIKRWSTTCHSNGREYVHVTFEAGFVLGKID